MQTNCNNEKSKVLYFEILRVIAIFFVIFNHTGDNGYFLFAGREAGSVSFWIDLFLSVFCKFSVPVFLAVSGAIMLNREDEPIRNWITRVLRIGIILVVFSLGYYILDTWEAGLTFSKGAYIRFLYSGNVKTQLWYLYLYIGYLMSLPLLRVLAKHLEDKYFYYILGLTVLYRGILPIIEYLLDRGNTTLYPSIKVSWVMSTIVLYPCLGYFLHHRLDGNRIKKALPVMWIVNVLTILLSCYMTYYRSIVTGVLNEMESQEFHCGFTVINCVTIFITVRYFSEKFVMPYRLQKVIRTVGECTFGVYLFHVLFLERKWFSETLQMLQHTGVNSMVAILMMCLLVMFISYILTFVISQIPIIKKVVGF